MTARPWSTFPNRKTSRVLCGTLARPYLSDSELDDDLPGSIFCSQPLSFSSYPDAYRYPPSTPNVGLSECRYFFTEEDFCEINVVFVAYSSGGFTPFEVRFNGPSYCLQLTPEDFDTLQTEPFLASLAPGLDQSSSQRSSLVVPLLIALVALAVLFVSAVAYLLRQEVSRRASQEPPVSV